jgi:hypothetical protein
MEDKIDQALSKKEKGFYNEMRAERIKRQEIQSQLDKLTGTINTILETRKQAAEVPTKRAGIPVIETEEGEFILPEEHISKIIAPFQEKINKLEEVLQHSTISRKSEDAAQRQIAAIVGEDESFGPAYQKYQAARQWANNKVVEFQRENGMTGAMTPGQALDYVFDETTEQEFADRFPGVPLDEVVTAEESQRNFRRMLKALSRAGSDTRSSTNDNEERLRKLLKKPSGLGSSPNAKAGHSSMTEKLGTLSPEDIFNLSDAQIRALQDALLQEEKTGGLLFK